MKASVVVIPGKHSAFWTTPKWSVGQLYRRLGLWKKKPDSISACLHPFIFWALWATLTWQDSASCLVVIRTVCAWHSRLSPWNICGSLLLWVILFSTHLQLVRKQGSYLLVDVCNLSLKHCKMMIELIHTGEESVTHKHTHTHRRHLISEGWARTWSNRYTNVVHGGAIWLPVTVAELGAFHAVMVVLPSQSCTPNVLWATQPAVVSVF